MSGFDILSWLCALVLCLAPLYALGHIAFFLVSLPLRRQERARFFMDLLESGLKDGLSAEKTIIALSETRDSAMGVKFYLLAAHIKAGWALVPALHKAEGLLPLPLIAMIKAGQEAGDLRAIFPACRALLRDGIGKVQVSYNYFIALAFVLLPAGPLILYGMTVVIFPKVNQVFADMIEGPAPVSAAWTGFAAEAARWHLTAALFFYLGAIFFLGGPRFIAWLQAGLPALPADWLLYCIPWRAKRIHRDFGAMLGALLDAGVPEERALELAGDSAANQHFRRRVAEAQRALRAGLSLPEALQRLDRTGELKWRLGNALRSGRNFLPTLSGWLESLDARAFQQEHTAAQIVTTLLVALNGALVGFCCFYMFSGLTALLNDAALW